MNAHRAHGGLVPDALHIVHNGIRIGASLGLVIGIEDVTAVLVLVRHDHDIVAGRAVSGVTVRVTEGAVGVLIVVERPALVVVALEQAARAEPEALDGNGRGGSALDAVAVIARAREQVGRGVDVARGVAAVAVKVADVDAAVVRSAVQHLRGHRADAVVLHHAVDAHGDDVGPGHGGAEGGKAQAQRLHHAGYPRCRGIVQTQVQRTRAVDVPGQIGHGKARGVQVAVEVRRAAQRPRGRREDIEALDDARPLQTPPVGRVGKAGNHQLGGYKARALASAVDGCLIENGIKVQALS